jgi:CubicO group peptidase (beta-lactamase class C family)
VMQGDEVIYQNHIGLANVEHRVAINAQTKFDLASVSKQFTGLAIATLIAQGKLSRSDEIHTFLPELPDFGASITVGHLLDHTSGLRDWDAPLALAGLEYKSGISLSQVLQFISQQKTLNFEPGSEQQYSNTGYTLLGEIITRVSGQSADDWVRQHIFAPRGMHHSSFNLTEQAMIADKAMSYEGRAPTTLLDSGQSSAIGSVLSSTDDLIRWIRSFADPKLVDQDLNQQLTQMGKLNSGESVGYAYGNWLTKKRGLSVISHLGLAAGFRTKLTRYPD